MQLSNYEVAYLGRVVPNLLDVIANLLDNLIITLLAVLGLCGVHLVQADNHLLHSQSVGQQGVLTSLAVLRDTGLETTRGGIDNQHGTVSLGSTGDHVLDEITVTWGVNDCAVELGCLELPQGNVNGDTTFTLGLELVQHLQSQLPSVQPPDRRPRRWRRNITNKLLSQNNL